MAKAPTKSTTTKTTTPKKGTPDKAKAAADKVVTPPAAPKEPEPITSERVVVFIPEETAPAMGLESGHYDADKITKSDGSTEYMVLSSDGTPIGAFQDLIEDDGSDADEDGDEGDLDDETDEGADSQANVGPVNGTLETEPAAPAAPIGGVKGKAAAKKAAGVLSQDQVAEGFKGLADALKATSKGAKMPRQLRWALKSLDAAQDQVMRYMETL